MRSSFTPGKLLFFIFALAFLMAFIQVGAITIVFDKLGLSQHAAFTLLFISLIGSTINLPLFQMKAEAPATPPPSPFAGLLRHRLPFTGKTVVAVNVGGCLIPLGFSIYLFNLHPLNPWQAILAITIVSAISYFASRPIPGLGIGMPIFIAPIAAALAATLIDMEHSAPLAYICGTMGVIIGADILRIKDIRHLGSPIASIGGAGTFDGIFMTGIVAVLLA